MTKIGIGKSQENNAFKAGAEAAKKALENSGADKCDFALVFAGVGYDSQDEVLKGVSLAVRDAVVVGCSAEGVLTGAETEEELFRVAVMAVSSDEMKFTAAMAEGLKEDSLKAGKELVEKLNKNWPKDAKALILLPDGLALNAEEFLKGVNSALKQPIPIVGGTASDNVAFSKTYQYYNGKSYNNAAVGIVVSGKISVEVGVSHGSESVGLVRKITKAEGNHIFTFDDKPAFDLFKEYLGKDVADLTPAIVGGVCLGVKTAKEIKDKYEEVILRVAMQMDKKDGSLYTTAEWPVGTEILLCRRDAARIIAKTREVAEKIKAKIKKQPKLILKFDCLGRGKNFIGQEMAKKEAAQEIEVFGKETPLFGFYSYGELASVGKKGFFHNWTAVSLIVY